MTLSLIPPSLLAFAAFCLCSTAAPAQDTGGGWTVYFQFDGSSADANLGQSVASAGDVDGDGLPDVLLGAPGSAPGGLTDAGSAFVYSGVSGVLLLQIDGTSEGESFGSSVASVGDLNADGLAEFIVGAPGASPAGLISAGSAIVFDGATGSVLYQFNGEAAEDHLGEAVANLGDVNSDGIDDILLGSSMADPSGLSNAGSIWVYSGADGSLIFRFDGAAAGDWLGRSISSTGDLNADGINDIVIGAHGASPGGRTRAGSVLVISGADGALVLQVDGSQNGDYFGFSVAGLSDMNGDGIDDLIAGAPNVTTGIQFKMTGAAYALSGSDGSTLLTLEGKGWFENYGWSVASGGDINEDGIADVMVGAPLAGGVGDWHGSSYLYDGSSGKVLFEQDGVGNQDQMGYCVANLGNITGRGFDEFVFAANAADPAGLNDSGSLTIFGIEPYITSDVKAISVAAGGTINFFVDFPDQSAGLDYRLLGSASGKGPTFTGGLDIPLTAGDFAWKAMLDDPPPAWFTDSVGVLDASGNATVTMIVPPDQGTNFIGTMFYFAAVTFIPGVAGLQSTIAMPLEFLP